MSSTSPAADPFWDALTAGDADSLRSILSARSVDVDSVKDGLTGLQFACSKNLVEAVKTLLDFNADHNKKDANGNLPIQLSTSIDVWRLLAAKMPMPQADIFEASKHGDDVSARLILAAATDPSAVLNELKEVEIEKYTKRTVSPLHVAANNRHLALCRVYLDLGAGIESKSDGDQGPLHWAVWGGSVEVVRLLVERGAELEAKDRYQKTPLMDAAKWGHLAVAKVLVEKGADVLAKDSDGLTAQGWAARWGKPAVAKFLAAEEQRISGVPPSVTTPAADTTTSNEADEKAPRIFPELTLEKGCGHHAGSSDDMPTMANGDVKNLIRLVHWPTKTIRIFCGLECPDLVKNGWRVIAISHVWGFTKIHHIPGVPWQIPIADEKLLESAFEGCQPKDLHWLDILSIHQESNTELAYSTKEMSIVFLRADAVCLWLPNTASPWPLLGTFEPSDAVMVGMIRRLAGETDTDPVAHPEIRLNPTDPEPLDLLTYLRLLKDAFGDPWFARVWTTQEMALAKALMFHGREFDLNRIRNWWNLLTRAHTLVTNETLEKLPLADLAALGWHATDPYWRNRIAGDFLNTSQDLRYSVHHSPNGCTLTEVYASVTARGCSYMRDKVLTMAPILKCDLELPDFDFDDRSEELAEQLWHHAVVKKMADGDISIVYDIVPGLTWRDGGLWHPALNQGDFGKCPSFSRFHKGIVDLSHLDGVENVPPSSVTDLPTPAEKKKINGFLSSLFKPRRSKSPNPGAPRTTNSLDISRAWTDSRHKPAYLITPQPGAYFIDDLPYDFTPPTAPGAASKTEPAMIKNVLIVQCEAVWKRSDTKAFDDDADIVQFACEQFGVSEENRKRSEKMFSRLHPTGLPRLYELTGGWHRGVAKVGSLLAPFWMHHSFAPNPDDHSSDWRTLKVMVVTPTQPRFQKDRRMRCWVIGAVGEEVPNSKSKFFPGPYGAVWIDWDMVHTELKGIGPVVLGMQ
ncbi:hypothetical protein HDU96_011036 [Phlyctochytrium bullatum]|nr:hypothetical protein HDU96_011036 [Phlyctochytrium bullatum]